MPSPRRDRLRSDLRASMGDAMSWSIMVGVGETYLAAFILAMHGKETLAGLIATVPILGGAALQLITPRMVRHLGSNRRWTLLCAAMQAASFIPLVLGAMMGWMPVWTIFLVATVYWGAGQAVGPAWNTWMEALIPPKIRPGFFARRSRASQIFVLGGLVLGGISLQFGSQHGRELELFATLFLIAGGCRFVSTLFLARQSEPVVDMAASRIVSPLELIRRIGRRADGQLIAYLLTMQFAVQVSGPFFTPFMLGRLQMSYTEYLLLIAASFMAKFAAFPFWGRLASRVGARRLLYIGGIGILPLSALWIVNQSLPYLFFVQLLGGVIWAAVDLGVFLLIFETIPASERTSVLTSFNFANAVAMVGGSLVGAAILRGLAVTTEAYFVLFALSGLLRVFTLIFLWQITADRRRPVPMEMRPMAVRPQFGAIERPVLAALDAGEAEEAVGVGATESKPV